MKNTKTRKPKGFSLKDRFGYWFDNRMTRGVLGLVRVLIIASVLLVAMRRRAAEETDEDELDWQEPKPVKVRPARQNRAERAGERSRAETPKRRNAPAGKSGRKTESGSGYKPRH